ncbi:MAG TPA: protein-export chaperone SecB [Nevskiales bacterium]|nr:protein-export chaperone SecB [Nevskiales bacterium]
MSQDQAAGGSPPKADKQVILQKIYVRDASLEVPNAPTIFTQEWAPKLDVQLNTAVQDLSAEVHHVVLTVTLTARLGERTAYHAEVQQGGVFRLAGFGDEAERRAVLGAYCPSVLFPFAREAVADLIQRGGFPAFLLQPVNFDALYHQHLAQTRAAHAPEAAEKTASGTKH